MDVETPNLAGDQEMTATPVNTTSQQPEEEDDSMDLQTLLAQAEDTSNSLSTQQRIDLFTSIFQDSDLISKGEAPRFSVFCVRVKESSIYALIKLLISSNKFAEILPTITTAAKPFFDSITKAKMAKIVRQLLDTVTVSAPEETALHLDLCHSIIAWASENKRNFLKQRVEAKLCAVLYKTADFRLALSTTDGLLKELKKLDDKQLLVESHLTEAKIHHALLNFPKAKAALTASRTAANAIYVGPKQQAEIDQMSGILHCEEGDYNTAHSYFLEAFEQMDSFGDSAGALPCLKYMMLCRILDSLTKALNPKAKDKGKKTVVTDRNASDLSGLVTGKQGVKYAGAGIDAMVAIGKAANQRSLKAFEAVTSANQEELANDLLIKHHLEHLYEQLLESNLVRIIEPFEVVEIAHISKLIEMPVDAVERKLSQMILDGKFKGILDQGKGHLIVYEAAASGSATLFESGEKIVDNMDKVVGALMERSQIELR
jgi:26S proteasome regulatory subunit N6